MDSANFSATIISKSKEIMQKHNLLSSVGVTTIFRKGELPEVSLGDSGIYEPTQYAYYEEWLKESIAFRDECYKIAMGEKENRDSLKLRSDP
jgi:hypothetical protein